MNDGDNTAGSTPHASRRGTEVPADTWVEVEFTVMEPESRVVTSPDTAQLPLVGRTRGFLVAPAELGAEVRVETLAGRHQGGRLVDEDPGHHHSFGTTDETLIQVGPNVRRSLRRWSEQA